MREDDRRLSEDDDDELPFWPLLTDDAAEGVGEARRCSRLADGVLISFVDDVRRTKLKEDDADALMGVFRISRVCDDEDSRRVDTLSSCWDVVGSLLLSGEAKVGERGLSMVLVHATRGCGVDLLGLAGMLLATVRVVLVEERGVRLGGTTP